MAQFGGAYGRRAIAPVGGQKPIVFAMDSSATRRPGRFQMGPAAAGMDAPPPAMPAFRPGPSLGPSPMRAAAPAMPQAAPAMLPMGRPTPDLGPALTPHGLGLGGVSRFRPLPGQHRQGALGGAVDEMVAGPPVAPPVMSPLQTALLRAHAQPMLGAPAPAPAPMSVGRSLGPLAGLLRRRMGGMGGGGGSLPMLSPATAAFGRAGQMPGGAIRRSPITTDLSPALFRQAET